MRARYVFGLSALSLVLASGAALAPAAANPVSLEPVRTISLQMDHTQTLSFSREAAGVVVGNPLIADVSVFDTRTVLLTGKGVGETNLIALDKKGKPFLDIRLSVVQGSTNMVRVWRGKDRETLACQPACTPAPQIGDSQETFDAGLAQSATRTGGE
jgi:Flp pilus assembly secretin CpaC